MGQAKQEHVRGSKTERGKWGAERLGHSTHTKNPPHPTLPQKSPHPNHTLLQYSHGEAGVAGRAVVGRGGTQNKNTWHPPRVKKRAEKEKKNTPVPHHHLRLPPRAPSPLHRCHAPRKRTLLFISSSLARARAVMAAQEERGASGAGGGATPHHFRQRGVSESADLYRFHPHVRRYSALHCASQHPFQTT